ncbi:ATP-binding protein [Candidatus Fermentibacteria bacterium]|nr:ATP-binding protein [Candidatus Fermentibacteria bacterium]
MLPRTDLLQRVKRALQRNRVVALLGPRQCGKTTLARQIVPAGAPEYFDLEDPRDLARLDEPMSALEDLRGVVVIDEIQRRPDLFPVLRVLADRTPLPARFVLLGSASPGLLRQSSESLAGRVERVSMGGLTLEETGLTAHSRHWLRGGFPLSFLARDDESSFRWRREFVQTFLERDVPQLGFAASATTMFRFWSMVAHYHGQIWNAAEPARSLGIGETTARRYLDLLCDLFMVRSLPAWHTNLRKRQVKSPKVYFRDSGLLHYLLGVSTEGDLLRHPKCGASWEGYVIEEILRAIEPDSAHFWATHQGAELDLLLVMHGRHYGIECKRVDAPRLTSSMRVALADLQLERIAVVYPGSRRYALSERVEAVPLAEAVIRPEALFSTEA